MKKKIENILKELEHINWMDIEEVSLYNQKVLENIFNDRDILRSLLEMFLKNDKLVSLSEHYDFFDKMVLYVDKKDRFRIRLHIFSGENSNKNRPHCHRWTYSSVILEGSYQHFVYGTEDQINEDTNILDLKPILIRKENCGSIYTLSHNAFHSISAKPDTVSVIIRGPAVKDRFLIMDKKADKKWWEYGRESETTEELAKKSMTPDYFKKLINKLYEMKII